MAVDEQFRMAAEIQRSLLPSIPAETPGYLWAARMESAHKVCGDFYDFVELNAGGPPLGLLPVAAYECGALDLRPADLGVLVTDGVTEAIEGIPLKIGDALAESRLEGTATPAQGCDYLLRVAASAPGPPGAGAWFDDRTVLAFRVQDARPS